jgi:hypothetical protein
MSQGLLVTTFASGIKESEEKYHVSRHDSETLTQNLRSTDHWIETLDENLISLQQMSL